MSMVQQAAKQTSRRAGGYRSYAKKCAARAARRAAKRDPANAQTKRRYYGWE